MKKIFTYSTLLFAFACSNQAKMGRVHYGKDGSIASGSSITKCTPPSKRYAKSLDALVKGSLDSVATLPSGNIELGLKQTVTRLSDYSSEGLDIDLILFRICEMANNRGLSAGQVEGLNKSAIDAWSKSKQTGTSSYNNFGPVTNYGPGIAAGVLVVPEDKEVAIVDNFEIINYENFPKENFRLGFELKPKKGVWQNPFVAYPFNEDDSVRGTLTTKLMASQQYVNVGYFKNNHGDSIKVKMYNLMSSQSSAASGSVFLCKAKPSIIFFGDFTDPKKYYVAKL